MGLESTFRIARRRTVAVIGASNASKLVLDIAAEVGRGIGASGWHLICGGGAGVMEAACFGFRSSRIEEGAVAIGILPGDDSEMGNEYLDVIIPSGIGWARNAIITRTADGVIAVGGGSGTLSEIAFAWQMGKPVAALAETGGWSGELAGRVLDDRRSDPIFAASSSSEAINFIRKRIEKSD